MPLYEYELCAGDCKVCGGKFTLRRSSHVFEEMKAMAGLFNKWILALGLIVLICVGCKQSNSKSAFRPAP